MNNDIQHLRLLAIFHYILGGVTLLIGSLPIFHVGMGLMMVFAPGSLGKGAPPPPVVGWLFIVLGGLAILCCWALGIALMVAGRFLQRHTRYLYCMVLAGLSLMVQPFGTVLGVFTIIVLLRPSVKHLFETGEAPYDPEEDETDGLYHDRLRDDSYNIHGER